MADSNVRISEPAESATTVPVSTRTDASGEEMQVFVIGKDGSNDILDLGATLATLATQTTLMALLAELGQKLEPADLTALATSAKQDAAQTTRAAIAGSVDGLEAAVTALATEVKLEAVRALLAGTLNVAPTTAGDVATTLTNGRKTVAIPGTAEALRTTLACEWVSVTAMKTNTQQVNVGGAGVLAASATQTGDPLGPGESITYPINDAAKVFVDARVAGEGVTFTVGA